MLSKGQAQDVILESESDQDDETPDLATVSSTAAVEEGGRNVDAATQEVDDIMSTGSEGVSQKDEGTMFVAPRVPDVTLLAADLNAQVTLDQEASAQDKAEKMTRTSALLSKVCLSSYRLLSEWDALHCIFSLRCDRSLAGKPHLPFLLYS